MSIPGARKGARHAPLALLAKAGAYVFVGVLTGLFIYMLSLLRLRYAIPILAALLLPVMGILSLNAKRFFQVLLVLSIGVLVRKTLVFVSPAHTGGPVGLDVLLVDYILFVLYALWVYEGLILKKPGEGLVIPKIAWIWVAFIVVSILSAFRATEVRYSIFEIFRQAKVLFFFLYVVNHFHSTRHIRMALGILAAIVILHTGMAFVQRFTGLTLYVPFLMPPPPDEGVAVKVESFYLRRPGGLFGNANSAACFLSIILPPLFSTLFWKTTRAVKLFFAFAFLAGLAALVDSYSRAGWITLPPAAMTFLVLSARRGLISLRRHMVILFAAGLFLLSLGVFYAKPIHMRLTTPLGVSTFSRLYLIRVSSKMIVNRPLLGHGVNNWNLSFMPYHHATYDPNQSLLRMKGVYHVVHNVFFILAVDTGLTGIFLFLWILYEMGKNAWKGVKSSDPFLCSLGIGLLTALQSFFIVESFDFSYIQYESILFMFWLLLAFSVILKRMVEMPPGPPAHRSML